MEETREIVTMDGEEFYSIVVEGESEGDSWTEEDRTTTYSNIEKGYESIEVVLRRTIDDKCFRFEYIDSPYRNLIENNNFPIKGKEVFPKTIRTVIYE